MATRGKVVLVYYSPTGTTRRVLEAVAAGAGDQSPLHVDVTLPAARAAPIEPPPGFTIIGTPVHEGRVPPLAMLALSTLPPGDRACAVIAVFGNKMAGIALHQLHGLASKKGFHVIGAGSFIGEHSFTTASMPVARGRPDERDVAAARRFGEVLAGSVASGRQAVLDRVPWKMPFLARLMPAGTARRFVPPPLRNRARCTGCKTCARGCPAGAFEPSTLEIDARACTRCMACARACPVAALHVPGSWVLRRFFKNAVKKRKEPRFHLPGNLNT